MSLETNANNTEIGKNRNLESNEQNEFEKNKQIHQQAKEFSNLFWSGDKKGALEFYQGLNSEVQIYIQRHKVYSLDLKGASFSNM